MKKIGKLRINHCYDCPYCYDSDNWCYKWNKYFDGKKIPKWCKFEDIKDKNDSI